jgi:hypothetical protein
VNSVCQNNDNGTEDAQEGTVKEDESATIADRTSIFHNLHNHQQLEDENDDDQSDQRPPRFFQCPQCNVSGEELDSFQRFVGAKNNKIIILKLEK